MPDYFTPSMRLYIDRLVNWEMLLKLRGGPDVDVEAEVGAYRTILETTASLAQSFEKAGREKWAAPAELTADGGAESPAHIREAYEKLREAGLVSLMVDDAYGGYGLPALLNAMYLEMIARADPSLMMVVGLQTGAAGDIQKYASEEIKREILPRFASGEVQGCMDLTEPQAGSDLGGIMTRATELPDGRVQVDGTKIYISNGGAEVHLVLARDADAFEPSRGTTRGLSLIMVLRHGPEGKPNGVRVTRLEDKFGIHGSATCEVQFDGAVGRRLGKKGEGFKAMLDLMNAARLGVGAQALGICEAAVHDAVTYANQREQFGKPIAEQPLVRAMLTKMAVNTEAVRAFLYRSYQLLDLNEAREQALARGDLPADEAAMTQELLERDTARVRLLTPLCKYFATEVCDDLTRDAMQVLGGIGFTMDADVAKMHADSLITTIYEGTSEIQASFALKEIGKGALDVVFGVVREEVGRMGEDAKRAEMAKRILGMVDDVQESLKALFSDLQYALMRAKLVTEMVIDVGASTELLHQAGADPDRLGLAEAYIRRRALETSHLARRIAENAEGRLERDDRLFEQVVSGQIG